MRWGRVIGVGSEYALTDRMTLRSEATYTCFQDKDFNLGTNYGVVGGPTMPPLELNALDEVWTVRTGLNFKFRYRHLSARHGVEVPEGTVWPGWYPADDLDQTPVLCFRV